MRRAATVVIAALALGACGGDEGLSQEEFQSQANEICERYNEQLQNLPDPQSIEDIGDLADQTRPALDSLVSDLRALEPPEDAQAQFEQLVNRAEEANSRIQEVGEAATSGDQERLAQIIQEGEQVDQETDRIARDLGLQACADQ